MRVVCCRSRNKRNVHPYESRGVETSTRSAWRSRPANPSTCDLDLHAFTAQTLLNWVRGVRRNYPYSTSPLQQDKSQVSGPTPMQFFPLHSSSHAQYLHAFYIKSKPINIRLLIVLDKTCYLFFCFVIHLIGKIKWSDITISRHKLYFVSQRIFKMYCYYPLCLHFSQSPTFY